MSDTRTQDPQTETRRVPLSELGKLDEATLSRRVGNLLEAPSERRKPITFDSSL